MESSSFKNNMDGTQVTPSRTGPSVEVANPKTVRSSDFLLRFLATVACLVAVIVLAVSKETKTVPVILIPNLPPINVEVSAKWQYFSAFVYLMVINIIAVVYGAISLVLSIATGGGSKGLGLVLHILDLMVMGLLLSANGAAAAVGLIGYKGNSHARWNKTCNVFEISCRKFAASIGVSIVGSIIFFLLIILTVVNLRKRSH